MFLFRWLSGTFSHSQALRAKRPNPATTSSHGRHNFRPSLEALEIRLTLSLTTLASFGAQTGTYPVGGVIMDSSGNLYGTTSDGVANHEGTVFKVAQGSGAITTLATFNGTNGNDPNDGLIMDSSGNLYGTTTEGGGASGYGTVFELASGSDTITTLASFNDKNGAEPYGGLIMDSSGNLYGTTFSGGGYSWGTVFEVASGSGTITTLASFSGSGYSEHPAGALIMDSSGNLHGTSEYGDTNDDGTVFELAQGSHYIKTLAPFGRPPGKSIGAYPIAGLIMDSSGNLYGTARGDITQGYNTVFELAHGSGTITALASFNGTNGEYPFGGVIMDSSGNLYGTTYGGGTSGNGTVFELAKGSGTITTLVSFNGTNGSEPEDALIMDGSGNLYGTTFEGGASKDGTVFELTGPDARPALQLSGLRSSTGAGASHAFTFTVPNAVGTTDTGYARTADFTNNERTANLTANDTAANIGTDPFSGVAPKKKGKPSISDTLFSPITGSLSADGF